jgi:hypothetical protein
LLWVEILSDNYSCTEMQEVRDGEGKKEGGKEREGVNEVRKEPG